MCLIGDQEIDWHAVERGEHLVALDEVDRGDRDAVDGPRIHAGRVLRDPIGNRLLIEDRGADAEAIEQLALPGVAKTRGADDQRTLDPRALIELRQNQPRLNRLAKADGISEEQSSGAG